MKKLICGLAVAALFSCGFVAGGFSNRAVAVENKDEPQVLRVKAVQVVNDNGEVVCTLGSFGKVSGLWVGSPKSEQTASLVQCEGAAPYLGFIDTKSKTYEETYACSLALTTNNGKPMAQIVGPDKNDINFVDLTKLPKMLGPKPNAVEAKK